MTLGIGLHYDVSPDVYHSDPCEHPSLSASIAHVLASQSPAHAWLAHPRLGGKRSDDETTKEMDHGSLLHALLLGRGRDVVLVDADDWRTKAAKEARDSAREQGAIPVLKHRLVAANDAAVVIRARLKEEWGINLAANGSSSEVVAIWEEESDDGTRVICRGQLDWLSASMGQIVDLKCGASAEPESCVRKFVPMGYDIQRAAYVSAIGRLVPKLAGRVDFSFAFSETAEPYAVTLVEAYGSLRELGERRWRRAVNTWARCLKTNEWPTYTREVVMAEAKPWELEKEGIQL